MQTLPFQDNKIIAQLADEINKIIKKRQPINEV